MDIKYRIPVICQNGHKAFWYCKVSNDGIAEHTFNKNSGVPREMNCNCPKHAFGEGWTRNGENQLWSYSSDANSKDVYAGDIIKGVTKLGNQGVNSFTDDKINEVESIFEVILVSGKDGFGFHISLISELPPEYRDHPSVEECTIIGSSYLGFEGDDKCIK